MDTADEISNPTAMGVNSKSSEDNSVDVEQEIPYLTVKNIKKLPIFKRKKHFESIPILIKDISKIEMGENFSGKLSFNDITFDKVMIYGISSPIRIKYGTETRQYSVDDGTGSIIVHFCHTGRNQISNKWAINQMDQELSITKREGIGYIYGESSKSDKCEAMINDMQTIMRILKKNTALPETFHKYGEKVAVVGAPFKRQIGGELRLWAYELMVDSGPNGDKEIFFKQNLIRHYRKHFKSAGPLNPI